RPRSDQRGRLRRRCRSAGGRVDDRRGGRGRTGAPRRAADHRPAQRPADRRTDFIQHAANREKDEHPDMTTTLETEIREQPAVIARLMETQGETVRAFADAVREFKPAFVTIAARGTSDNAARYAQYVWGTKCD